MAAETSYSIYATISPQVNDVFNRPTNKYLSGLSRPLMNVVAASYTVPKVFAFNRFLSTLAHDWQVSALLRYTSAQPMRVPSSSNNIGVLLARTGGASATFQNLVPGQAFFTTDINSHYDPNTSYILNPAAWTDPPAGQWSTSTAYYNDLRGRRHPTENVSIARNFGFGKDRRMNLQLRAEFNNIFNRLYIPNPQLSGSESPTAANGSGKFGYINMNDAGVAGGVRTGQIVARFSF